MNERVDCFIEDMKQSKIATIINSKNVHNNYYNNNNNEQQ